jgi:hypothetical protein
LQHERGNNAFCRAPAERHIDVSAAFAFQVTCEVLGVVGQICKKKPGQGPSAGA